MATYYSNPFWLVNSTGIHTQAKRGPWSHHMRFALLGKIDEWYFDDIKHQGLNVVQFKIALAHAEKIYARLKEQRRLKAQKKRAASNRRAK